MSLRNERRWGREVTSNRCSPIAMVHARHRQCRSLSRRQEKWIACNEESLSRAENPSMVQIESGLRDFHLCRPRSTGTLVAIEVPANPFRRFSTR